MHVIKESDRAHIEQTLNSFSSYIKLMENKEWVNETGIEEIKSAFKLAIFIEKATEQLEAEDSLDNFLQVLKSYQNVSFEPKPDRSFFKNAADHILLLILTNTYFNENKVDNAIRIYTSSFSESRLQNLLETYIIKMSSYSALLNFVIVNVGAVSSELKFKLCLKNLSREFDLNETQTAEHIDAMLSFYNVEECLGVVIGVLAINSNNEKEKNVQRFILNTVLRKMTDRSILSKTFWLTLFKMVPQKTTSRACKNFRSFLESLWNFIIYVGSMMESKPLGEKTLWITNPNTSICPEISFKELLSLIRCLCELLDKDVEEFIMRKINEAYEITNSQLWLEVKDLI